MTQRLGLVALIALALRLLAYAWVGPGPFGPDGPGALAAVQLGGHPYPLHPLLIGLVGGPRLLSVLAGTLTAVCAGLLGRQLGLGISGPGLAVAAAPLMLYPSALAGGDAAALGVAAVALVQARPRPLLAGLLFGTSLMVKPVTFPLILPLAALNPWTLLTAVPALALPALGPLIRPKPAAGLLGSWWLASNGAPAFPDLALGFKRMVELPFWTGHPVMGALAAIGCGRAWRRWLVAGAAMAAVWAVLSVVGDAARPRYIAAASLPLALLAGGALRRVPPLSLGFAWPALGVISAVAAVRALEEDLPPRPVVPFPAVDAGQEYLDSGVCGASELRGLAIELAATLPQGAEVDVLRLRDGRDGELRWPLLSARPDIRVRVVSGTEDIGPLYVGPANPRRCATALVDPGEEALMHAHSTPGEGVFGVLRR